MKELIDNKDEGKGIDVVVIGNAGHSSTVAANLAEMKEQGKEVLVVEDVSQLAEMGITQETIDNAMLRDNQKSDNQITEELIERMKKTLTGNQTYEAASDYRQPSKHKNKGYHSQRKKNKMASKSRRKNRR